MTRPWRIAVIFALGLVACRESAGPSRGGSGGLTLEIVPSAPGSAALDSGYVRLTGAKDTTAKVTPGTNVTIANLAPGTYTLGLEGFAGGGVAYFGQTSGVQVTAGNTTSASVTFNTFVSTVSPLQRPGRKTFTVNYASVTNASSYEVFAATDSFLTLNVVTTTATGTSASLTVPTYERYFVGVRAVDPYGTRGRLSPWDSVTVTGVFYVIKDEVDSLQILNPATLALTNVGPLGVAYDFGDCAWNPVDNSLYMVDGRAANTLYRVNVTSGAATAIGVHGVTDMFAIGYHPPTNAIYAVGPYGGPANLYRLNLTTGAATLIGATGVSSIEGLIWDAPRNRFVGLVSGTEQFYTINVATGVATSIGGSGSSINDLGLTYDPRLNLFWSVDYSGFIFQYNPFSLARTQVSSGRGAHSCIAHVP
jgi:hypothetical protein